MNKDKNILIKDIVIIICIIVASIVLLSSKYLLLNIVISVLVISFSIISSIKSNKTKAETLKKLKSSSTIYMVYKESLLSDILLNIVWIFNSILCINNAYTDFNLINRSYNFNEFLDFIKNSTTKDLSSIVIFVTIIIVSLLNIFKSIQSNAVICDDRLVFHNGTILDFGDIVSTEYVHQYFSIKKSKVLKIRSKQYNKKIVVRLEDDDRLKTYIDSKIQKNNI